MLVWEQIHIINYKFPLSLFLFLQYDDVLNVCKMFSYLLSLTHSISSVSIQGHAQVYSTCNLPTEMSAEETYNGVTSLFRHNSGLSFFSS